MPIQLDQQQARTQLPVLKIPNVGDSVIGALVDVSTVDLREFATGEIERYEDGAPKQQKVLTVLVLDAVGDAHARHDGEDVPAPIGEPASIFTGHAGAYAWRDALDAHGQAVNVGDTVIWALEREEPAKTKGFHDRKVRTFAITEGTDPEIVKRCEEQHLARQPKTPVDEYEDAPF